MIIPSLHAHAHLRVCVYVHLWRGEGWYCQLDSLKIVQSGGLQLHGTLGAHDHKSNRNFHHISLGFVTTDETRVYGSGAELSDRTERWRASSHTEK